MCHNIKIKKPLAITGIIQLRKIYAPCISGTNACNVLHMYKNHFDSNNMPVLLSIQRKMAIGHGYCSQFVYVEA